MSFLAGMQTIPLELYEVAQVTAFLPEDLNGSEGLHGMGGTAYGPSPPPSPRGKGRR